MPDKGRFPNFSIKPIVPFSALFTGQLDIYRLGNLLPTINDELNSRRPTDDLSVYYKEDNCINIDSYLSALIPTNELYNSIVKQQSRGNKTIPVIEKIDKYNERGDYNEDKYVNGFVNHVFDLTD